MLEAKGEIETLADDQRDDRYVGHRLLIKLQPWRARELRQAGGQAKVPGHLVRKALTDNVNELAANLTTQVRAIAEVAIAVTKGI